MFLTVEKTKDCDTYTDCFNYLAESLSGHFLLTDSERKDCVDAVGRLKSVFGRFERGQNG